MTVEEICRAVEKLKKKYHEKDPFRLCEAMGIRLLRPALGTGENCIKGFFMECKRIRTITVNGDLPEIIQKIIVAHELGHAVLHRKSGIHAFHDVGLFDVSSVMEKDANLFAAEFLLEDEAVLELLNGDNTFFSAAAVLQVPMELLDFKFRMMKRKGYKLTEPPVRVRSNFMKEMAVPYGVDAGSHGW